MVCYTKLMNPKRLKLVVDFLRDPPSRGCSDWDFPSDWTPEERRELVTEMLLWNGDLDPTSAEFTQTVENFSESGPPDHFVVGFLISEINKLISNLE